jgi:hypothetical protein
MTRRKDDESDDDDRDPKFSGRKGSDYDEWIKKVVHTHADVVVIAPDFVLKMQSEFDSTMKRQK